jgi:hypothetical protein
VDEADRMNFYTVLSGTAWPVTDQQVTVMARRAMMQRLPEKMDGDEGG